MKLPQPLFSGVLIQRYKRFLADVALDGNGVVTAHCPNSGSMKGVNIPGSPVLLSKSLNPRRKLAYTWELVKVNQVWVGINTIYPNRLVEEGIHNGLVQELQGYSRLKREAPLGEHSRVDLLLEKANSRCYVEVKNVTLVENGVALFPDAVTLRGQKHLQMLAAMVAQGHRGVMVYVVQREDCDRMAPADDIDPTYGALLRQVVQVGVEAYCYQARVTPEEIVLRRSLPILL